MKTKKVNFKNGYVVVPNEWLICEVDNAVESDYVCVIEVKNGKLYNAPHVVFFSKKKIKDMNSKDYQKIHLAYKKAFSGYNEIVQNEIKADTYNTHKYIDINGNEHTEEEFLKAPQIGIFYIDSACKEEGLPHGCSVKYRNEKIRLHLHEKINQD